MLKVATITRSGLERDFSNLCRAGVRMGYDSGLFRADVTPRTYSTAFWIWMITECSIENHQTLCAIDKWLGELNIDDLDTVCTGEVAEAAALLKEKGAPARTGALLDEIFEAEVVV